VTHEDEIAAHCHRVLEMQDGKIVSDVRQKPGRTASKMANDNQQEVA
jgi:ABC-type lipoprotein export system ATPase subunit